MYDVQYRVTDEWAESLCLALTSRAQMTSQTWRPHISTTRCFAKVGTYIFTNYRTKMLKSTDFSTNFVVVRTCF